MLDRVLHPATVVQMTGEGYRQKDKRRAGIMARPRVREAALLYLAWGELDLLQRSDRKWGARPELDSFMQRF